MLYSSPKEIHKQNHWNARFWRTICSFNLYINTKYTVENAADLIADMHSFFWCWPHMYSKRQKCSVNIHDRIFFSTKMWLPDNQRTLGLCGGKLNVKIDPDLDDLQSPSLDPCAHHT